MEFNVSKGGGEGLGAVTTLAALLDSGQSKGRGAESLRRRVLSMNGQSRVALRIDGAREVLGFSGLALSREWARSGVEFDHCWAAQHHGPHLPSRAAMGSAWSEGAGSRCGRRD